MTEYAFSKPSDGAGAGQAADIQKVIPTIFIALGGSGKQAAMRLRKRLLDHPAYRGDHGFVRFLFIDTDPRAFRPDKMSGTEFAELQPRPDEQVECLIREEKFYEIFDRIEKRRDADELAWLKPRLKSIGPRVLQEGAGTHREFGRLAFYIHAATIRRMLERQIEELLDYAAHNKPTVEQGRIEVVVITSLAGGTGSGMFLDAAYLVGDLLRPLKGLDKKYFTLIAFMPTLYKSELPQLYGRLKQNAYAALLELEYYSTSLSGEELYLGNASTEAPDAAYSRVFSAPWKDRSERRLTGVPWGTCYLIDNVNDLEPNTPLSQDEVFQMTADFLFMDFERHEFAVRKRSARSNLVQFTDRPHMTPVRRPGVPESHDGLMTDTDVVYYTQNSCRYSSFGTAEIFFDLDRLYRAAGYRLASHLIRRRWIGAENRYQQGQYARWAAADLAEARGPQGLSLDPEALRGRLLTAGRNQSWSARLEDDLRKLDQVDPAQGLGQMAALWRRHDGWLRPDGEVDRTLEDNVATLRGTTNALGALREHLAYLVRERLARHGVTATLRLIGLYRARLKEAADGLGKPGVAPEVDVPLERLREASRVGAPVRRLAQQIEYPRARAAVAAALRVRYANAASARAQELIPGLIDYLGAADTPVRDTLARHGTQHGRCSAIRDYLGRVQTLLDNEYKLAAQGRVHHERRKQALAPDWADEDYDRKINETLILHGEVGERDERSADEVGAGAADEFRFDWKKFEAQVVSRLGARAENPELRAAPDYFDEWIRNWSSPEKVERVADRLADICQSLLREQGFKLTDLEGGNVIDLLMMGEHGQRSERIEMMVISSAPYFPTFGHPADTRLQPTPNNLYGHEPAVYAEGNPKADNARQVEELVRSLALARDTGPGGRIPRGIRTENPSSLFLVRETAGFPLFYYSGLDTLYRAYHGEATATNNNNECHIDYRLSEGGLPDIRPLDNVVYARIAENIDHVLLALMTGVIVWAEDQFLIDVPDKISGSNRFSVGSQLYRMIRRVCEERKFLDHLIGRWVSWKDSATTAHWACLYASAFMTYGSVQGRVIEHDRNDRQAPPIRNCYGFLIRNLEQSLAQSEGGPEWIAAIQATEQVVEGPGGRLETFLDRLSRQALVQVREDLPIFLVDRDRVGRVTPPEAIGAPAA